MNYIRNNGKAVFTGLLCFFMAIAAKAQNEVPPDTTNYHDVFIIVEESPEFPGGQSELIKFLQENVVYPDDDRVKGVEGRVYVTFVVDEEGFISRVQILNGTRKKGTEAMRKEAIRVVNSMPRWKPGYQNGKPVKVKYTLPFTFKLG